MLELLQIMFPKENVLPNRNYDAKKILCPISMNFKKVHACLKDCVLYKKDQEGEEKCSRCEAPQYKEKGNPAKVLWYISIIPRFKRLFVNTNDAKNLRWHANKKISDGKFQHPDDSSKWKKIDRLFSEFGNEPRNLRLGLSTNGMNPYGSLSSIRSIWPVLLVIYNLSPRLCMKQMYKMLSMLISGSKQLENDSDICLRPLIEDLKEL